MLVWHKETPFPGAPFSGVNKAWPHGRWRWHTAGVYVAEPFLVDMDERRCSAERRSSWVKIGNLGRVGKNRNSSRVDVTTKNLLGFCPYFCFISASAWVSSFRVVFFWIAKTGSNFSLDLLVPITDELNFFLTLTAMESFMSHALWVWSIRFWTRLWIRSTTRRDNQHETKKGG